MSGVSATRWAVGRLVPGGIDVCRMITSVPSVVTDELKPNERDKRVAQIWFEVSDVPVLLCFAFRK